jgi:hypothetical protein
MPGRITRLTIAAVLIFIFVTLISMRLGSAHDGVDEFGFPFTFYDRLGGKCDNCYEAYGFRFFPFLIDLALSYGMAFVADWVLTTLRGPSKG